MEINFLSESVSKLRKTTPFGITYSHDTGRFIITHKSLLVSDFVGSYTCRNCEYNPHDKSLKNTLEGFSNVSKSEVEVLIRELQKALSEAEKEDKREFSKRMKNKKRLEKAQARVKEIKMRDKKER